MTPETIGAIVCLTIVGLLAVVIGCLVDRKATLERRLERAVKKGEAMKAKRDVVWSLFERASGQRARLVMQVDHAAEIILTLWEQRDDQRDKVGAVLSDLAVCEGLLLNKEGIVAGLRLKLEDANATARRMTRLARMRGKDEMRSQLAAMAVRIEEFKRAVALYERQARDRRQQIAGLKAWLQDVVGDERAAHPLVVIDLPEGQAGEMVMTDPRDLITPQGHRASSSTAGEMVFTQGGAVYGGSPELCPDCTTPAMAGRCGGECGL
jgi:hypothetical protein